MPREVRVRVPATSANLGPGFDCLGMSLSLYNHVRAQETGTDGVHIEITGEGADSLPRDETNLVYRTMQALSERSGRKLPGLRLQMHNEIPSTRGLGSSATAIVLGLALANELLDCGMSRTELLQIATQMEGHPDNVAPAILGGVVVAGYPPGKEIVAFKQFKLPASVSAVVAIPEYEVSTDESRAALPAAIARLDAVYNVCQVGMMMASLAEGDFATFAKFANDRLHEPYRLPLMRGLEHAIRAAREAGANSVTLSGSGPSLLALCETGGEQDRARRVEDAFRTAFKEEGILAQVLRVAPDEAGVVTWRE